VSVAVAVSCTPTLTIPGGTAGRSNQSDLYTNVHLMQSKNTAEFLLEESTWVE